MGSYPVTFGGQTFTSGDFAGHNYVHGFPSLLKAANQAISERVGLTFTVNQDIAPMLGPLVVQAPVGLPIIANTLLSFAVPAGGAFLMRVNRYSPETGQLSGQVVLVRNPKPETLWTVGMDRVAAVADVDDGGSGLWRPEQMPLARQQLGLPGIGLTRIREEFHEGRLPAEWVVYPGAPGQVYTPLFPNEPQWDGVGTYQSRSYMRLSAASDLGKSVIGPPLRYESEMVFRLAVRKSPAAGGFVGYSIEAIDRLSSSFRLLMGDSDTRVYLGWYENPIATVSAVGTTWEDWEFHISTTNPCQAFRNGTLVHTAAPYPEGVGSTYPKIFVDQSTGPSEQYMDIDYFYAEVAR